MGWYGKITGAKNRAAKNEYWGGVIEKTVGGSVAELSNELKTRRTAEANEKAIGVLNPNLAGKGLGDALARNPSLSESLLGPYIQGQNRQAEMDSIASRQTELERFSNENQTAREAANDERDFKNARTLDTEREGRALRATGFASEADRDAYLAEVRKRDAEKDEADRKKVEADTIFTQEQRGRSNADDIARAKKITDDEARRNEPLPKGFSSDRVPPRYMARIKTWGELEAEEERQGKLQKNDSAIDVNAGRTGNFKSLAESREHDDDLADKKYDSDVEAKNQDRALRASTDKGRTFRAILGTDAGKDRYASDPAFKSQADQFLDQSARDALGVEGAAPADPAANPKGAIDNFKKNVAPTLKNKGASAAFQGALRDLESAEKRLETEKKRGRKDKVAEAEDEIRFLSAQLEEMQKEDAGG